MRVAVSTVVTGGGALLLNVFLEVVGRCEPAEDVEGIEGLCLVFF